MTNVTQIYGESDHQCMRLSPFERSVLAFGGDNRPPDGHFPKLFFFSQQNVMRRLRTGDSDDRIASDRPVFNAP